MVGGTAVAGISSTLICPARSCAEHGALDAIGTERQRELHLGFGSALRDLGNGRGDPVEMRMEHGIDVAGRRAGFGHRGRGEIARHGERGEDIVVRGLLLRLARLAGERIGKGAFLGRLGFGAAGLWLGRGAGV